MKDVAGDIEWFEKTRHCGACGQPGSYCLCRKPCGCKDLHPVGSGLAPEALDQFAESVDIPGQDELWPA